VEIKVILKRDEAEAILAKSAAEQLYLYRCRDPYEAAVTGSYGYGDVTVTFAPKKVEPEPTPEPTPAKTIEVITDVTVAKPSLADIPTGPARVGV
jgi:hypothetical protein